MFFILKRGFFPPSQKKKNSSPRIKINLHHTIPDIPSANGERRLYILYKRIRGLATIQCRPRITQVFENPHARNNRDNETIERNPPSGSNAVFAPPLLIIWFE